jgi:hypothetical protein
LKETRSFVDTTRIGRPASEGKQEDLIREVVLLKCFTGGRKKMGQGPSRNIFEAAASGNSEVLKGFLDRDDVNSRDEVVQQLSWSRVTDVDEYQTNYYASELHVEIAY